MKLRNTMKARRALAALGLVAVLATTACTAESATSTTTGTSTTQSSQSSAGTADAAGVAAGGPGAGTDPSSVSTEAELVALIQDAYGDSGLGLHRGHEPVQDVLDEVLTISHDELHVRMEEQGQNLAAVADDLGVGQEALIAALVESWSPAIDTLLANGTITESEAEAYRTALTEAFTFRVTWDGQEATPTFAGLEA